MNSIIRMELREIEVPMAGKTLWPSALYNGNWYAILPDIAENCYYLYNRHLGGINVPSECACKVQMLFEKLNEIKPHLAKMGQAILWEAVLDLYNSQN